MTLIEERPAAHAEHNYTRWAWIAVALTPILFVAGIIISLAASGASPGLGGALVGLLSLAAPTAAVILAVAAMRAEQPAARTVLTASLIVYVGCVVLLPIAMISVNSWLIALAASVVVFAVAGWRLGRQSPPPR